MNQYGNSIIDIKYKKGAANLTLKISLGYYKDERHKVQTINIVTNIHRKIKGYRKYGSLVTETNQMVYPLKSIYILDHYQFYYRLNKSTWHCPGFLFLLVT